CERKEDFDSARRYYQLAGQLNHPRDQRLVLKEARRRLSQMGKKTTIDYLDFWNTGELMFGKGRSGENRITIDTDLAYEIGVAVDVREFVECVRSISSIHQRNRLRSAAVNKLMSAGLHMQAGEIADQLEDKRTARNVWSNLSQELELKASIDKANRFKMLRGALTLAKLCENKERYSNLLVLYIGKIVDDPSPTPIDTRFSTDGPKMSSYVLGSDPTSYLPEISKEFFEEQRSICVRLLELLKCRREYIQAAELMTLWGLKDREVFEQSLNPFESNRNFMEAACIARALEKETLAKTYSFMASPDNVDTVVR
ncbi:MAG: hypothetical protein WB643_07320, partial [Candidatus Bathyarchaeia archaeon]